MEEPVLCVLNKQKKPGVLKFIGETQFSSGVWCGIALSDPCGKNDGSVAGVRYFQCDEQHGIFVNPKNVFPTKSEDEQKPLQVTDSVMKDEESPANKQRISDSSSEEGRPRSKSDVVINEKKADSSVFSSSPFKCNIGNAKSSSLSKLNNVTYICSPQGRSGTDTKNLCEPMHSSLFLSETSRDVSDGQNNEDMAPGNVSSTLHHHTDLSPKFEIKQSIKLGSINTARFPAPAGLGKDPNLNKTFLVRTENRGEEQVSEQVHETLKITSDSNERSGNNNDRQKQESITSLANQETPNATFVSTNESDSENGRARSASKSSWSSAESLSSVGSVKSSKGRSRLNGTKTPRKLPCPTECSKSKLVKVSAEKKQKPKGLDRETATQGKVVLKSASKPANDVLAKKSRTKSTSVVAPRSVLATPSVSKSAVKTKSKSVSSDLTDGQPLSRSRLNASKFATPLSSKISAPPSSRLTSTPICKKPLVLETKSKFSTSSNRTSSISSLSRNAENEQKNISRENSNVENNVSVKNKQSSSIMSAKKEKESKPDVSRSRYLSTSTTSNKSLSAKSRTLSTSAAPKAVAARGRNLSASCNTRDEIKPPVSKLRNMSTSRAEGGISKIKPSGE